MLWNFEYSNFLKSYGFKLNFNAQFIQRKRERHSQWIGFKITPM